MHHKTFTLDEFIAKLPELKKLGQSMMYYMFPFENLITVEFRQYNPGATGDPDGHVWPLRNYMWATSGPAVCAQAERDIPIPAVRYKIIDGLSALWRFKLENLITSDNTIATDQMIRYPGVGGASRYTFSLWAFPTEIYPTVLAGHFEWSRKYYETTGYRTNMLYVGYSILKDQQSLLSYSYDGDVMTIDPVSTANPGWNAFLDEYNELLHRPGGHPPVEPDAAPDTRAGTEGAGQPHQEVRGGAAKLRSERPAAERLFPRPAGRCGGRDTVGITRITEDLHALHTLGTTQGAYDFVIIGSGYGGAITAARLAAADLNPKPSICILERGKEWQPGNFPETLGDVVGAARSDANPLGLFELLNYPDISVIKGSGLGGTSLINANVAILPDREVFEQFSWPSAITYDTLLPFYQTAHQVLGANPASARAGTRQGAGAQPPRAGTRHVGAGARTSWSTSNRPAITRKASTRSPATIAATASPAATWAPRTRCT